MIKICLNRTGSKRVIKLIISLAFFMAKRARDLIFLSLRKEIPGYCAVLYYHEVSCHQDLFGKHLDILTRFAQPISTNFDIYPKNQKRYVSLVFCDGFEDFLTHALPELIKRNIPATLFIPTGFLGCPPSWEEENDHEGLFQQIVLNEDQIRDLPHPPIIVGSHGVRHNRLTLLSKDEAMWELRESQRCLQEITKREIKQIFFPYGAGDEELIRLAREIGYNRVFLNTSKLLYDFEEEFVIGCFPASPLDWSLETKLKAMGAYSWLPYSAKVKHGILRLLGKTSNQSSL